MIHLRIFVKIMMNNEIFENKKRKTELLIFVHVCVRVFAV